MQAQMRVTFEGYLLPSLPSFNTLKSFFSKVKAILVLIPIFIFKAIIVLIKASVAGCVKLEAGGGSKISCVARPKGCRLQRCIMFTKDEDHH